MKRKIFPLLFTICFMVFFSLSANAQDYYDGSTTNTDWYGDGSEIYYNISTTGDLVGLVQLVNGGNDFSGKTITLQNDLFLVDDGGLNIEWATIGTETAPFEGTFDGAGHLLKRLSISSTSDYQGLFGHVGSNGMVKNIKAEGSVRGSSYVGGIVGYNSGTIINCSYGNFSTNQYSTVTAINVNVAKNASVGGVAGYVSSTGKVINCYNYKARIRNEFNNSGLKIAGGVVGESAGVIANCYNGGSVTGVANSSFVGGIVGYNSGGTVANSYNLGSVSVTGGSTRIGGVVGADYASGGTITNCYYLTDKGANTGVGDYNDNSYSNIGTFNSASSGITLDTTISGNTDNINISKTNLLTALNDGTAAYNAANSGSIKAYKWQLKTGENDNYPVSLLDWAEAASSAPPEGNLISTGEQLAWLINNPSKSGTYTLTKDIDLSGREWTPIGSEIHSFDGTFNGANYKITGLQVNAPGSTNQGLFSVTGRNSSIKNLSVAGSVVGASDVGGMVGYSYGTIENCNIAVTVSGSQNVGGVVGYNYGTIKDCTNSATVFGTSYVGGVAGYSNSGDITNCSNSAAVSSTSYGSRIGGVAGYSLTAAITNCSNSGNISAKGNASYIGGIVPQSSAGTITNCYNTGTISANGNTSYVGGLAGYRVHIINCYNTGEVFSTGSQSYVGGLIATSYHTINSYNTGRVSAAADSRYVGGVAGMATNPAIVKNSYYLADNGASQGVGYAGIDTTTNVGSFSSQDSVITLDPEILNPENIPHTNLLTALNAGADAYNTENPDATKAMNWSLKGELNNGYPLYETYWINFAKAPENNLITSPEELAWLIEHYEQDSSYTLTKDIDLSDHLWAPIGTHHDAFYGTFDGAGYKISGMYIHSPTSDYQGLFGYIGNNSTVKNVNLYGSVTGKDNVGGMAGNIEGSIIGCSISVTVKGDKYVGGVTGRFNNSGSKIINSSADCTATGNEYVGVITGNSLGTITNCNGSGTATGIRYVSGVAGQNGGTITNSYYSGTVKGNRDVGSVVGYDYAGEIINCYYFAYGDEAVGVGASNSTSPSELTNIGSFSSTNSEITIDEGITATETIPTTNLAAALNTGAKVYNFENSSAEQAREWMPKKDQNNGYPVFATYWIDNAIAPKNNQITSPEEMAWLINNHSTQTYTLSDDIDLSEHMWQPIGTLTEHFNGTFDGEENTVTGFYVYAATQNFQGLFGFVGVDGIVKDISVYGNVTGFDHVGGLVGYNQGNVTNSSSAVTVRGNDIIGGVVGDNNGGSTTDCNSDATVTGNDYVGGVVGRSGSDGILNSCSNTGDVMVIDVGGLAGGVVGQSNNDVSNSYNTGTVSGSNTRITIGGVTGDTHNVNITNCYNTGALSATGSDVRVGGVAGSNLSIILNSYNTGTISIQGNSSRAGGVAASNTGYILNSYNTGDITTTDTVSIAYLGGVVGINFERSGRYITNCYNTGELSVTGTGTKHVAGIAAFNSADITNSYYLTGKGAAVAIADNQGGVLSNIGSFNAVDSEITLDADIDNPAGIPNTDLLTALNAGTAAYNKTVAADAQRMYMWDIITANIYPIHTDKLLYGDVNDDWVVDEEDLKAIAADSYNTKVTPESEKLDVNEDGVINFVDLAKVRNIINLSR